MSRKRTLSLPPLAADKLGITCQGTKSDMSKAVLDEFMLPDSENRIAALS